jgi:chromosome segregation ATPase
LDALSSKVVAAAEAHGKLVDSLKEAQTSINNTILSNKPDLSSLTAEIRSLFQAQETKIKEQDSKIATLTTLVNGQGTLLHELKDQIKALPTSPSFTSADRETLNKNSNILTSQASLLTTICSTLQQLLTTSTQTPAVAEGEKAAAAAKPSSSVPPVISIEEEEEEDA